MKNNDNLDSKKEKKVNKIKEQLARLRAKLASEKEHPSFPSKSEHKKTKDKTKQAEAPKKAKEETKKKESRIKEDTKKKESRIKEDTKKKESRIKEEVKKKAKEAKKKKARIKEEVKKKAKEAKKKKARIKEERKKKAKEAKKKKARIKEETKKKEEEAKKKEEEAKRTYEEELEEQLTEDEITGFQLEKTDMDKMCNRVCEIIADYETDGVFQSELWKKLKLSSRDGSRLALKLERMGMITREKILEKERWTYKLIIKKIPVSTKSIEGAPCLTCPVQSKCSIDGEISPKTCQWIEDWVMIELKNK